MVNTGLVSITFRQLSCPQIIELVRRSGLEAIEWGGDVHVPHGDVRQAAEIRRQTEQAGIRVASYGSYYRVGHDDVAFGPVLDTAVGLGAPVLRVWGGKRGSQDADEDYVRRVRDDARAIAQAAGRQGIRIAFEFHGNTLLDTNESAVRFLEDLADAGVSTYWQPPACTDVPYRLAGLMSVLPYLTNVHVFEWDKQTRARCPLREGFEEWKHYLSVVAADARDHHLLLEFVMDDQPEQFLADAQALKQLVREVTAGSP